jgi:hypothetical protein
MISAVGDGFGVCPNCGTQSLHRHGWHERRLQDLPAQGAGVTVKLRTSAGDVVSKLARGKPSPNNCPRSPRLWRAAPFGRPNSFISLATASAAGQVNG